MNNLNEFENVINNYEYIPEPTQTEEQNDGSSVQNNSVGNSTHSTHSTPYKKYSSFSAIDCENYTPPEWVIEDYIIQDTLNMMFGAQKSGKSYVALDMAFTVATPKIETWHKKEVKHGHVIYFAGEGGSGIKKRLKAWRTKYGIRSEEMNLTVIDENFKIDGEDKEHSIETTIWNIRQISNEPVLIVFDTLNRYMAGDENSTRDATKVTDAFSRIQKETGAAVLVLHHTGHSDNAKNRARGSSVFGGNFDCMLQIEGSNYRVKLIHHYSKDEEKQPPLIFNLEKMEIPEWYFKNGKPVTACTIEINEEATTIAKSDKPLEKAEKLSRHERTGKESYEIAAEKYGETIMDEETGTEIVAVNIEDWRKEFYKRTSSDNPSTKRGAFNTARGKLYEEKHIFFKRIINDSDYYCLATNEAWGAILKDRIEKRLAENPERTSSLF